jgi:polyisoprenoid-binding protein YceI
MTPEPGLWTIDPIHSSVTSAVEHLTISLARGFGSGPVGTITVAPDVIGSSVEASIDVSTLTTGSTARDRTMLGPEGLDLERFATIDFRPIGVRPLADNRLDVDGLLSLRGVTRPVPLAVVVNGWVTDNHGVVHLGLSAATTLHRDEFGFGAWGHIALPSGGFIVPNTVRITLDIEAIQSEN